MAKFEKRHGVHVNVDLFDSQEALPSAFRDDPVAFPPVADLARTEFLRDLGEGTLLYDRIWTEVENSR